MKEVFIVDAIRTPVGKYAGALRSVRPDDLLAHVIKELIKRNSSIDINAIEDVIAGDANQAGEDNRNVARMAALLAGLPVTVPGSTMNRLCASGLEAIMNAARQIMCGDAELIIAAGVESMTRAPFVMSKASSAFQRQAEIYDTTLGWRFKNDKLVEIHYPYSMGETAENVARQWKISREKQDEFALASQQKYFAALECGKWKDEIVGTEVKNEKDETVIFDADEHPRRTSLEKLASLKPAFAKDGSVTAGNSSGINDGAAAMLLASGEALKKFGLKPLAKIISMNEAFASQSIACIDELGMDINKVNVNGGAIAIGHPLGCSGVRISTTLIHEMKRSGLKYGLATMCVGVGQGASVIYGT